MKNTFESKLKSIGRWSNGYLVVTVICAILVLNTNGLKKFCVNYFHKSDVMYEYAYRAMNSKEGLEQVLKIWSVKDSLKKQGWTIDSKIIIIPYKKEGADTLSVDYLTDPRFFNNLLCFNSINFWTEANVKKLYQHPLLKGKVDMKSYYENGFKEYPSHRNTPVDVLKEYRSIKLFPLLPGILSFFLWISILSFKNDYESLVKGKTEYSKSHSIGDGYVLLQIFLFVALPIMIVLEAYLESERIMPYLVPFVPTMIVFILLWIKTRPVKLISEHSMEVDMSKIAPDLYTKPFVKDFCWFVPLGHDSNKWKKKALETILEKRKKQVEQRDENTNSLMN